MPLRIFNNLSSLSAQRNLGIHSDRLGGSLGRVASGIRLTKSGDDGAALALSERLRADSAALKQGVRNITDATTLVNVIDGSLQEQSGLLIRLRELASQAATGTIGQTERDTIQLEFDQLKKEFDRISGTTEFNGLKPLSGALSAGVSQHLEVQVGLNSDDANRIDLNQALDIEAVTTANLGIDTETISTPGNALSAMDALVAAIDQLSAIRSSVGSVQSRLQKAFNSLNVSIENLTAAESRLRDADLPDELTRLTRDQILVQSATAMVGQANLIPQGVFALIEGI